DVPVSAPTAETDEHARNRVGADLGRPRAEQAPPLRAGRPHRAPSPEEQEPVGVAVDSAPATALSRLAAHQAQIGELHRAFLAQQTTVHERFLTLQQSSAAILLQTYGAVVDRSAKAFASPARQQRGAELARPRGRDRLQGGASSAPTSRT